MAGNGRQTCACVKFGGRTFDMITRPYADGFDSARDLEASRQKGWSPDPKPTQVWRPPRPKWAGSAAKRVIFHVFLKRFANTRRKRQNPYVRNVWRPSTGPDRRVGISLNGWKRAGRTHVAFGSLGCRVCVETISLHMCSVWQSRMVQDGQYE